MKTNVIERDVQADKEGFPKIAIGKVGIKNIELPVWIKHDGKFISTMANISSYCDLVEDVKGINMSRILRSMLDIFNPTRKELITDLASEVVKALQFAHDTSDVYFKARFKYPYYQKSPITDIPSPEVANVTLEATMKSGKISKFLTVEIVGMSLCPCSKEMSMLGNNLNEKEEKALKAADLPFTLLEKIYEAGFGAHNQKSRIKLTVELDEFVDIEDLIRVINLSSSTKTFSVLKRPDEKYVTEMSYMGGYINDKKELVKIPEDNSGPKFVEDIARQLADFVEVEMLDKTVKDYVIVVLNQESIHSNDIEAVAVLTAGRKLT